MDKIKVFISHISEEKDLAILFKEEITECFLGFIEVFLSSDQESISAGDNWLNKITENLKGCSTILLFCSKKSVTKPWINFECGAGWGLDIPIVPICHSGMEPISLPLPLNILQGIKSNSNDGLEKIFLLLSKQTKLRMPKVNYDEMAKKIKKFEDSYRKEMDILFNLNEIKKIDKFLFKTIKDSDLEIGKIISITSVPESLFQKIEPFIKDLHSKNYISAFNYSRTGLTLGDNAQGILGTLSMKLSSEVINEIKKM